MKDREPVTIRSAEFAAKVRKAVRSVLPHPGKYQHDAEFGIGSDARFHTRVLLDSGKKQEHRLAAWNIAAVGKEFIVFIGDSAVNKHNSDDVVHNEGLVGGYIDQEGRFVGITDLKRAPRKVRKAIELAQRKQSEVPREKRLQTIFDAKIDKPIETPPLALVV